MPEFAAVVVPYELGRLREGVGCGPEHLLERGGAAALAAAGADVAVDLIELDRRFTATGLGEGDAAFELIGRVAERVRAARDRGAFPVLLAGSCFNAVGVVAGLDEPAPAAVWFDAHSDFSEPSTTTSGYFDSMGLAVLTGSAWQAMLAGLPAARPLPEDRVVLAGARAFDPSERVRLDASAVMELPPDRLSPQAVVDAVSAIEPAASGLYLHLDLDVLDRAEAAVNIYGEPGGPTGEELVALLDALLRAFPVPRAVADHLDPAFDTDDRVPAIAMRLLETLARSHAAQA